MDYWTLGLIFVVGVVIGVIIGCMVRKKPSTSEPLGTLVIDRSDPDDGPYMFLEIGNRENVAVIMRQEAVTLKVEQRNYVSR